MPTRASKRTSTATTLIGKRRSQTTGTTIEHGEIDSIGVVDLAMVRHPWVVTASEERDDGSFSVRIEELPRRGGVDGSGQVWLGGSIRSVAREEVVTVDGGFVPAPLAEAFAQGLLAAVRAAKRSHESHWAAVNASDAAETVEIELDLLRPRARTE
jgi:hypothetical protein